MPQAPAPPPEPIWSRWLSTLVMAALVAYSCYPMITVLVTLGENLATWVEPAFMQIMLGALVVIFLLATRWLLAMPEVLLRIERGCRLAGCMMLLTIPVLLLAFALEIPMGAGEDPGRGAAAFFMLIIFGGYYGLIGVILLILSYVMARRRQASTF